ncbi:lytic murein transglycosylase B [Ectothiorhodospiraceae bacterium BW-2]|nr:lytic murein transglycosylase B [Ectothiorhodospiraceae bacterium BW-2]
MRYTTFFLFLLCHAPLHAASLPQAEVNRFIQEMVEEHSFDATELGTLFESLELQQSVLDAISRPAERTLEWHQYRPIFLKPERIRDGAQFWRTHETLLQRAEEQFGTPAEIIVAIIGVETRFGQYQGRHRVAESLATLAFAYPPRAKFFRQQLKELFLIGREEGFELPKLYGSYAGAMGQPQFIPSSYRAYAIDFDGDGKRDLWNSMEDIVGSVANYLARHRWQRGKPIASRAEVSGSDYKGLLTGYKPHISLAEAAHRGVKPQQAPTVAPERAALIELKQQSGPEYWLVYDNFYAITRYNHSELYAMAVFQLAEAIRSSYQQ